MGNYKGQALTTGCSEYEVAKELKGCAVKTELMDMKTLTWADGPDYPFLSFLNVIKVFGKTKKIHLFIRE